MLPSHTPAAARHTVVLDALASDFQGHEKTRLLLWNKSPKYGNDDREADGMAARVLEHFCEQTLRRRNYRGGSFKAWLMRTVTNACYDELRRQKRRPTTPLEPETNDGDEMDSPRWLADPNMTPSEQSEADELEHAIQHCLDALPTEFRAVVVLADIQGMDYSEVATSVRVPLGTIKSRLARARLRLRECLRGFEELLPSSFRLEEERIS